MKYLKSIIIAVAILALPSVSFAAPTSWDYAGGILQPLRSQWGAEVKLHGLTATSTTFENTLPRLNFTNATGTSATTTNLFSTTASSTNLFGAFINGFSLSTCNDTNEALTWASGSFGCTTITAEASADSIATSTAETSGRVPFWTSTDATPATLSGGVAGFVFDSVLTKLTVTNLESTNSTSTNATSTNLFATTASSTNLAVGTSFNFLGTVITNVATWFNGLFDTQFATKVLNDLSQTSLADPGADQIVFWDDSDTQFEFLSTLTGLAISGNTLTVNDVICTECLDAGVYGAASIDGDDINSNLAGRSLTLTSASPDTLDLDSEIYTFAVAANLVATSTADGIATTTEKFLSVKIPIASTVTAIDCYAADTGTSTVKASYTSNPISAGTQIVSAGTTCGSQALTNVTSFDNSSVGAGNWLNVWVHDAEPTGSRPRIIYFTLTLTKND